MKLRCANCFQDEQDDHQIVFLHFSRLWYWLIHWWVRCYYIAQLPEQLWQQRQLRVSHHRGDRKGWRTFHETSLKILNEKLLVSINICKIFKDNHWNLDRPNTGTAITHFESHIYTGSALEWLDHWCLIKMTAILQVLCFQTYFLAWFFYCDPNFTEVCSLGPNWQYLIFVFRNGQGIR